MIRLDKILRLSKQFIAIKSIAGNSNELEEILELALLNLKEFKIEKFEKKGVKSVLIYNQKNRPKTFRVILNGHLDVIPGGVSMYKPKVVGDRLYGVGSMDMKSNVACFIELFQDMAKKVSYPLALQLVTDEQTGSLCGTKYQIDQDVRADFVIVGESTNFNIVNKAKGVIWLKILAKGKAFHSAYPWQGKNAVWKMIEFLNNLKAEYPVPDNEIWETTVNVSHINSEGNVFNKIPDVCEAWLDIRYVPGEKNMVMNKLGNILPDGVSLKIIFEEPPMLVSGDVKDVMALCDSATPHLGHKAMLTQAHGTSDANYYARIGCPAVEFGPIGMSGNMYHEYVSISSLEKYYQILTEFLLKLKQI